jgi:S1-C subfamily serine protease
VSHGAWVQSVSAGGPAAKAGLRAGNRTVRFQIQPYKVGGDVIVSVARTSVMRESDLATTLTALRPGERVEIVVYRRRRRLTLHVVLGNRPAGGNPSP